MQTEEESGVEANIISSAAQMEANHDPVEDLRMLLRQCVAQGASDVHISADWPPVFRLNGSLQRSDHPAFAADRVEAIARAMMNDRQWATFQDTLTMDLGYTSEDERFRVNIFRQLGKIAIAVRHLDNRFLELAELNLPRQLKNLAYLESGLVLVCGATGNGKSTTLAALIHEVNVNRDCHVITVEDPVEFVHANKESLIHQRELLSDVPTFAGAVRSALREDPDVIMVGEMRDVETMAAALTAAETGHLVFSTLHTGDAIRVVERLVGAFAAEEQSVIRHRVAMVLKAVVAQFLLPTSNGQGRVPAVEVMLVNKAISHMISMGRTKQIYSVIESNRSEGMQTLDQCLASLVRNRKITRKVAERYCRDIQAFGNLLSNGG